MAHQVPGSGYSRIGTDAPESSYGFTTGTETFDSLPAP